MGQEVKERAIYMFVVVYRMFQKAHGKIKKISSTEIIECYEHNERLLERLEGGHNKFLDRVASVQTSRQPYVLKYGVDALMEDDEAEDVKTVINALDQRRMRS
jgi:hypothetical protein